jgi:chaperone modulatory protein CbpM
MVIDTTETLWLHEHYTFTLLQMCEMSGLDETELRVMVDEGILDPVDPAAEPWCFCADRLTVLRSAIRLSRDFELDAHGVSLAVALLDRVHTLEAEVRELRAKLPGVAR